MIFISSQMIRPYSSLSFFRNVHLRFLLHTHYGEKEVLTPCFSVCWRSVFMLEPRFSLACVLCTFWGKEHLFLGIDEVHSGPGACVRKYTFLLLTELNLRGLCSLKHHSCIMLVLKVFCLWPPQLRIEKQFQIAGWMYLKTNYSIHSVILFCECINSKNLVALEGHSSFYWWYFFLRDDHVKKKILQTSKAKKGSANNRGK